MMLKELRLERFKNFQDATLKLGPFTTLLGANASGKSNIRDALRFLHGLARGYTVTEILFGKTGEGGEPVWSGIRGAQSEIAYRGSRTFALTLCFDATDEDTVYPCRYWVHVFSGGPNDAPRVHQERIDVEGLGTFQFDPDPSVAGADEEASSHLTLRQEDPTRGEVTYSFRNERSALAWLLDADIRTRMSAFQHEILRPARQAARLVLGLLGRLRFLELAPDVMREPSPPGQTVLGDRGANLASVLEAACENARRRSALVSWVQELTPTDVTDLEFRHDPLGRLHLYLIERDGRKTSIFSASDGTVRFLGLLAALLGTDPAPFYFIEEMENGIHPARLSLLIGLVEQVTQDGKIQMVTTSHSPQLLQVLRSESLANASVVYRLPEQPDGRVTPVLEVPTLREVIDKHDISRLQESGWFETTLFFAQPDEDESPATPPRPKSRRRSNPVKPKERAA